MENATSHCPNCGYKLSDDDRITSADTCPSCGSFVEETSQPPAAIRSAGLEPDQLRLFKSVDSELYNSLSNIVPEASWQLAVMAEILDFEYTRLNHDLNQTPNVQNCILYVRGNRSRVELIKQQFQDFFQCLSSIQDILIRDLDHNCTLPGMVNFWEFHQHLARSFDRLGQCHRAIVNLKFVRDSVEHHIQGLMVDWVHYVLICIEGLKKQLDRKSKLDRAQLHDRSIQVTLAPPNLHTFFAKLDELTATDRPMESEEL